MKLNVLQSGFVAIDATRLELTPQIKKSFKDSLFSTDFRMGDTVNLYDEAIEQLFSRWRKDNTIIQNFDFREMVIKAAFRTLGAGADDLTPFLRAQINQRTVGYIHRKCLVNTLMYLTAGTPRDMDLFTYYRLTEAEDVGNRSQPGNDKPEKILEDAVRVTDNYPLSRLICTWTQTIDGFVDLLKTLEVIFGKRSGYMAPVNYVEE